MNRELVLNDTSFGIYQTQIHKDRPTIIFLHDSLGCIATWRDFPDALGEATGCNVLVYDRQGYGQSAPFAKAERTKDYLEEEADVLHEIINACGIAQALLFGHSDGGSIALIAAAKYPDKIKAVVTEGAHIFVEDVTLQGIRAAVETYRTTNLGQRLEKYHGDKTDAVFWAWAKTWLTDEYRSWNIEQFLPRITCPVLVIQGEQDEFGSMAQVDGIVHATSGTAEKLMIPRTGHSPHKEAREIVLERSVAFLRQYIS